MGSAIGLGFDSVTTSMPMLDPQSMATRPRVGSDESEANSLGLEGLEAGMAPDVDDQVVDA